MLFGSKVGETLDLTAAILALRLGICRPATDPR